MGWIKLNRDGAVYFDAQKAIVGGVLFDAKANWLWGFNMRFGNESIFKVEARDMLERLFLARNKGYKRVEVESDNALLVELLHSRGGVSSNLGEVRLIHQLLQRNWEIYLRHVTRNVNKTADIIAKLIDFRNSSLRVFSAPLLALLAIWER